MQQIYTQLEEVKGSCSLALTSSSASSSLSCLVRFFEIVCSSPASPPVSKVYMVAQSMTHLEKSYAI